MHTDEVENVGASLIKVEFYRSSIRVINDRIIGRSVLRRKI